MAVVGPRRPQGGRKGATCRYAADAGRLLTEGGFTVAGDVTRLTDLVALEAAADVAGTLQQPIKVQGISAAHRLAKLANVADAVLVIDVQKSRDGNRRCWVSRLAETMAGLRKPALISHEVHSLDVPGVLKVSDAADAFELLRYLLG